MCISIVCTYAVNARETRYLLRDSRDGRIWWGCSDTMPESIIKSSKPADLPRCAQLDQEAFFTKYTSKMHRYSGALDNPSVFVKYTNTIRFNDMADPENGPIVKATQEREIWAAEKYRSAPHANICEYLGVVTDAKALVIGTVYRRYTMDLRQLVERTSFLRVLPSPPRPPLHADYIMAAIQSGTHHIHSLGLVHCDIRPDNVFVDVDIGRVVIGDFDGTNEPGNRLLGRTAMSAPKHTTGGIVGFHVDIGLVKEIEDWLEDRRKRAKT